MAYQIHPQGNIVGYSYISNQSTLNTAGSIYCKSSVGYMCLNISIQQTIQHNFPFVEKVYPRIPTERPRVAC